MEVSPHVVIKPSANPYHQSFALCVGQTLPGLYNNLKRQNGNRNEGPRPKIQRNMHGYEQYRVNNVNAFHCDRCDRSFNTKAQLDKHVAEHVTCGMEGCQFTAHPKVVENHVRMQHLTGLYKKISQLNSDDDIAKWIAERKRKYPTLQTITEKTALDAAKQKRGERINADKGRFSNSLYNKSRQNPDGSRMERRRGRTKNKKNRQRRNEWKSDNFTPFVVPEEEEEVEEFNGNVPAFRGTGCLDFEEELVSRNLVQDNDVDEVNCITDDDESFVPPTETASPSVPSKPVCPVNKSLGLLMASYNSDSSDDDGPPEETSSKIPPCEIKPVLPENGPKNDNSSIVSIPKVKAEKSKLPRKEIERKKTVNDRSRGRGKGRVAPDHGRFPKKPTLLERLLSTEIIHERNVILQCIRYVVDNNFFDKALTVVKSEECVEIKSEVDKAVTVVKSEECVEIKSEVIKEEE